MARHADRLIALIVGLVLAAWFAAPAIAHTRSETHSSWQILGPGVELTFTVPDLEAKRLTPDGSLPNDQLVEAYLAPRVYAQSGGKACRRSAGPAASSAEPGYRRYDFTFHCPDGQPISIHSGAFFDLVPMHVNYAQIQTDKGEFIEQLLTRDQQTLDVSNRPGNRLQSASFFEYIELGILHIFTGLDHQSFLLGLVLISRRVRDLVFVITGFTIGHSVTLALAVTGIIRPHAQFIDALIALTIALIGAENVAVSTRRPGVVALGLGGMLMCMALAKLFGIGGLPSVLLLGGGLFAANYLMISGRLADAGRLRLVVTLVFGLVHGFGFASDLLQMKLPTGRLAELLVGFNLGVEIGQLTLVLAVLGIVALLARWRLTLPRPIVVDIGSAALVGIGMFWFISRSFA